MSNGRRRYSEWLGSDAAKAGVAFGAWIKSKSAKASGDPVPGRRVAPKIRALTPVVASGEKATGPSKRSARQLAYQKRNIEDGLCMYGRNHGAIYRMGSCLNCYQKRRPKGATYKCAECQQIGHNARSCGITLIKAAMS